MIMETLSNDKEQAAENQTATMEIQTLTLNFLLYILTGLWLPIKWTSELSKLLYSVYNFFVIYLIIYLMLTNLMYIIFMIENIEDFVSSIFLFFSIFNSLFKVATAIIHRDRIINLIEILHGEPCEAYDEAETDIQIKFDRSIRLSTMEIQTLTLHFLLYTLIGLWRPIKWTSKLSKLLYSVYTFFVIYMLIYLFLTHFMYIIFVVKNIGDFVSCTFLFSATFILLVKAGTVIIHRDRIIKLIEILQEEPCKACDKEETDIQMKFDCLIRSYTMPYLIMCTISVTTGVIGGFLFYILEDRIPYGFAWVPWDCSSFLILFLTSIQEIIAIVIGAYLNCATETIVLGFCLQICARFEILKHRLQKMIRHSVKERILTSSSNDMSNKTSRLAEHVFHHLLIIRFAEVINDIFSQVIFVQFTVSIVILCSVIYNVLSNKIEITDISSTAVCMICMFVQIFYYCWSGNEVTLKSAEFGNEIYNMDWISMTSSEQKNLLLIMKRSTRPIKLSSSFLVTLSLESYAKLMKTSFSAFNLMQQL